MNNGILIISYKRIECKTWHILKDAGYTGELYIVADDKDDTDYEGRYGSENVLRFSKEEYLKKTDTVDNFGKLNVATHARNFCLDFAKLVGWDCVCVLDDDLNDICYRCISKERGKKEFKRVQIKDFNKVLDAYAKYALDAKLTMCSFFGANRAIGGYNGGELTHGGGVYYAPTQAVIINMHELEFGYIGTIWSDYIFANRNNELGKVAFAAVPIFFSANETAEKTQEGKNEGGLLDFYKQTNKYVVESYVHIVFPTKLVWKDGGKTRYLLKTHPLIINEKWKK